MIFFVLIQVPTINIIPPLNSPVASSITSGSTLASPMSNYASSPATTPSAGPGTIQHLTSQFIKEGLKMKVKQNMGETNMGSTGRGRRTSSRSSLNEGDALMENKEALLPFISDNAPKAGSPSTFSLDSPMDSEHSFPITLDEIKKEDLTPDDENRRKRRRERNKVAATKCRNKKKARTQILIKVKIDNELYVIKWSNNKTIFSHTQKIAHYLYVHVTLFF